MLKIVKCYGLIAFVLSLVSIILTMDAHLTERNGSILLKRIKRYHHHSPHSWGTHDQHHEQQYYYDFHYHDSFFGHSQYGNPSGYDKRVFPNQNPSQRYNHDGQFIHPHHAGVNFFPGHQHPHYTPFDNGPFVQQNLPGHNGFPAPNPQVSNIPSWQNIPTNTGFTGYPNSPNQNINNGPPGSQSPITNGPNDPAVTNNQANDNPSWQNTPTNTGFTGYPNSPNQNINNGPPGSQSPITNGPNDPAVTNNQANDNPSWQNTPTNTGFTGYPNSPNQNINNGRPGSQSPITNGQNDPAVTNNQTNDKPSWQNTQQMPSTGFTGNPNTPNVNNGFRPESQSPIADRLTSLSPPTRGDQLGAFINSNIFGTDSNQSGVNIGPTGVLLDIKEDGGVSQHGYYVPPSCDEPYTVPQMPDFSAEGRRISDVRCYEYIWQLRTRDDREDWDRKCGEQNVFGYILGTTAKPEEFPHMEDKRADDPPDVKWLSSLMEICNNEGSNSLMLQIRCQPWNGIRYRGKGCERETGRGQMEKEGKGLGKGKSAVVAALGWNGVNGDLIFRCGASLISPNFVLTAAHCTSAAPDPKLADVVPRIARIGGVNIGYNADGKEFTGISRRRRQAREPDQLDVAIINIIRHEQYDPNRRYFDIALMQLEYNLEFTKNRQPACLWTDINSSSRIRRAVGAGWGVTSTATNQPSLTLQAGELDIIDVNTCNDLLSASFGSKFNGFADHQLCAGKLAGGSDVCQGDSGGPLQVKLQLPVTRQGSMHTILGVISAGVGCAKPNTPGVYTRVTSFVDWIERYVWP